MKRYEFSLWDNCTNNCTFCWTSNSPKANLLNNQLKITSINTVIDYINNKIENNSDVLITGGELFDNKDNLISQKITELIDCLFNNLYLNKIHDIFIITNLIHSNESLLNYILNKISNLPKILKNRIHITTSYDIIGRFKCEQDKQEFLTHLKQFSNIINNKKNIVVNTILTKSACNAILNGIHNIKKLQKEYNCSWDLIPFVSNINEETPSKKLVFDTLKYIENKIPGYINKFEHDFLSNTTSIALKIHGSTIINATAELNKNCNHSINYTKYANDTTSCFMCDLDKEFNISKKNNGYLSIELWPDCTINCPFCFNKDRKLHKTPDNKKIEIINKVIKFLKNHYYRYTTIQIMGGEFFNGELDNPIVLKKFLELCKFLNNLAVKKKRIICIYSALKDTLGLKESLDILYKNTKKDQIKFNSSFNYNITHFKNTNYEDFVNKVLNIRSSYPKMKIHIQSLLSNQLISSNFEDILSIYEPFLKNNIEVDFHPVTIIGINTPQTIKIDCLEKNPAFLIEYLKRFIMLIANRPYV